MHAYKALFAHGFSFPSRYVRDGPTGSKTHRCLQHLLYSSRDWRINTPEILSARNMPRARSCGASTAAMVRVRWRSRAAGFTNDSVENIIRKVAKYFGLGYGQPNLVLLCKLDGEEVEVTNDILEILSKGTTLTLSRTQKHECPNNPPASRPSGPPSHIATPDGMFVWVVTLMDDDDAIHSCLLTGTRSSATRTRQWKASRPGSSRQRGRRRTSSA
ncbi:hypothetical protein V8D89_001197 [Ganoderma adspersum]